MSWVKLDDGFYDNPKILRVGLAAAGLYAAALSYAARKLTDGFLPEAAVFMLTSGEEDGGLLLSTYLVEQGLWTVVPGGYQIHDFLDYNPPAAKIRAERAAAKKRMLTLRSGNVRPKFADSVPVPVPVPREYLSLATLAPAPAPGFDDFWQRYPLHVGKQAARKAWGKLGPSPPLGSIVDALAWQRDLPRWREDGGRYVPHPATYLNGRRWEDERPPPTALERFAAEGNTG
jgi:hypothetical protein